MLAVGCEAERAAAFRDSAAYGIRARRLRLSIQHHRPLRANSAAVGPMISIGAEDHGMATLRKELVKLWSGDSVINDERTAVVVRGRGHVN